MSQFFLDLKFGWVFKAIPVSSSWEEGFNEKMPLYRSLVCLIFMAVSQTSFATQSNDSINVIVKPDTLTTNFTGTSTDTDMSDNSGSVEYVPASARYRRVPAYRPFSKPITKCQPLVAPVMCAPPTLKPPCIVPKRFPGQFEAAVQVFFASIHGTMKAGPGVGGIPATEMDFSDDLGLPVHRTLLEYSAWCQFRPHWAIYYSILPISLKGDQTAPRTLYYRGLVLPQGTRIHTKWDFTYQRVGLVYQAISNCNAVLSIYGSWLFNEQKQQVHSGVCSGQTCTVSRTRQMAMAGVGLQKCIRTKCNGATLSCDNKVNLGFLDNTFVLDVQTGLQFSVPMNAGRWGFVRGGYRLLNFNEDREDLKLNSSFEGGFVKPASSSDPPALNGAGTECPTQQGL